MPSACPTLTAHLIGVPVVLSPPKFEPDWKTLYRDVRRQYRRRKEVIEDLRDQLEDARRRWAGAETLGEIQRDNLAKRATTIEELKQERASLRKELLEIKDERDMLAEQVRQPAAGGPFIVRR